VASFLQTAAMTAKEAYQAAPKSHRNSGGRKSAVMLYILVNIGEDI